MQLRNRIRRLESQIHEQARLPKRPVPEWYQETMERQGYVFDRCGQLISAPQCPATSQEAVTGAS